MLENGQNMHDMTDGQNTNDVDEDSIDLGWMFPGGDHQADNFKSSVFESLFYLWKNFNF